MLPKHSILPSAAEKAGQLSSNLDDFEHRKSDKEREEWVNNYITEATSTKKLHEVDYLDSEVLLKAPKNFFDRYEDDVRLTVLWIQNSLSEKGDSNIISEVKKNPSDTELRHKTYLRLESEFLNFTGNENRGRRIIQHYASKVEKDILKALVINELIGLGPLEPLWQDNRITEIICNGPTDVQVEINGNVHKVRSCKFRDSDHLQKLIDTLYASINKSISRTNPMERGRLPDNSRMMAVHQVVAPDGPNFNIRRHSEAYWGPDEVIKTNTADIPLMTYLGNLIYNGVSFLVVGGTGTGKTTLLDALTAYYRPDARIVTLEDNLEMKPHPRKLFAAPMECVDGKPGSLNPDGITMRDLVHASLQMRPEVIIIGEVTDSAAYDLCQALNTGHAGASTLHSNSASEAIYRLMSLVSQSELIKGRAAYDLIASAFDIIITVERFPVDGSRKITAVDEVGNKIMKDDEGNQYLPTRTLWKFEANKDVYQTEDRVVGKWNEVAKLSDYTVQKHHLDLKPNKTWDELKQVAKV